MRSIRPLLAALLFALPGALSAKQPPLPEASPKPNIIFILADDLGYGDVGCYGAKSVATPNVDRLAKDGLRFTSGYCTSATCTPSRYSLMTGEYAFRKKGTGVLPGDAALILEPGRTTLPSLLHRSGYQTAVVGKWHLGLGSPDQPADWNAEVKPGPLEVGFDYSFIMAATGDRVPCVYVENHRVVGLVSEDPIRVNYKEAFPGEPDGVADRSTLNMDWSHTHNNAVVNGIGRLGFMKGGKNALWKDEDMADVFTRQALAFIEREKQRPFFLYFATHDIHVPRVPHPRYAGKSGMGPRGDAILEFDGSVGEILRKLDELKLSDNTLVILSSDNGPVLDDGYQDRANEALGDHKPGGPLRAGKYSLYEGGTRVPFIARWPARIKPGVSSAMISQVDLPASLGALCGQAPDKAAMPDSLNLLPALLGESATGRDHVVEHANRIALRKGDWKFIPPGPLRDGLGPHRMSKVEPPGLLFNLASDPGEETNLAAQHPEKIAEMTASLAPCRSSSATQKPAANSPPRPPLPPRRRPAVSLLLLSTAAALAAAPKPNILFIMADDQAPWSMHCAGDPHAFTPNMDRLAREGSRFSNAFTPTPVCSPSRASLMTGRYGSELGITDWIHPKNDAGLGLDPRFPTWPRLLSETGYQTALIGKWHLGDLPDQHPTKRGYQFFMGFLGGGTPPKDPILEKGGVTAKREGFIVDLVADEAIDWIKSRDPKKPFALSLHFREPHAAYLPVRDEDWARVKDVEIQPPQPVYPGTDVEKVIKLTRDYLASVAAIDRNLGRVLESLDSAGIADNTLVVYTSDHGYNMGHHGIWHKGNGHWILRPEALPAATENIPKGQRPNMFDTSIKVPMLMRWPGRIPAGVENRHVISHLDWLPTFAELAGAATPKDAQLRGKSIASVLSNPAQPGKPADFYAEYSTKHQSSTHMRAYRTADWKLVRDFKNPGRDELYHLAADPGENTNLIDSADPAAREALQRLDAAIRSKMGEINDPLLAEISGKPR